MTPTRRVQRRIHGYMLHKFTHEGLTQTDAGDYPTRELAETVGEALQSAGVIRSYDVEACDHEGFRTPA